MQECLQALPPNESKKQNKQPKNEVYTERGSPVCLREEGKTSLKKKYLSEVPFMHISIVFLCH
jgi:hypothetical protein